jgi:hypothetical protein
LVVTLFFFLPESEVLFQKFDDTLRVTEAVLFEFFNLVESFLESFFCEFTCDFRVLITS